MSNTGVQDGRVTVPAGRDDLELAYRVAGDGPPLVCLHGIGLDSATVGWREAPRTLADRFTVYALDLPNHGDSEDSRNVRTTEDYVEVFGAFLETMDLERATLAGLSMGGAVALGHTLNGAPDPEGLVLVDSYGLGADAPWRTAGAVGVRMPFADAFLSQSLSTRTGVRSMLTQLVGNGLPEGLVDDVRGAIDSQSLRAMRRWQRHEFRHDGLRTDYRSHLADLDVPTLLIHGEHDPLLPLSWSIEAKKLLPDSELLRLPGVGHWPPREEPERVLDAIGSFANGR